MQKNAAKSNKYLWWQQVVANSNKLLQTTNGCEDYAWFLKASVCIDVETWETCIIVRQTL